MWIPSEELCPSHHQKQELPGNTWQTPQALLRSHQLQLEPPARRRMGWDGGHGCQSSPQTRAGSQRGERAAGRACKAAPGQETLTAKGGDGGPASGVFLC